MKKFLPFLLMLLCLALCLSVGCTEPDQDPEKDGPSEDTADPFGDLCAALATADSYTAVMCFTWEDGTTDTATFQKQGAATHMSAFLDAPETYTKTVQGALYAYTDEDGWQCVGEASTATSEQFAVFFTASHYGDENADGRFPMLAEATPDGYSDVTVALTEDGCVISACVTRDEDTAAFALTLSAINETEFTLPD